MYSHSDPTANRAIGSADREWLSMVRLAYRFRTDPRMAEKIPDPGRVFTGIFRRLLTDPLNELQQTAEAQGRRKRW
jgi:hypothetical protein